MAICTPVGRVIQSTQSEFMGLYPYINTQAFTKNYQRAWESGKGTPTLKIRQNKIDKASQLGATIDGLTLIPIYNYLDQGMHDDISWQGCHYVKQNRNYRYNNETSYKDFSPFVLD